MTAAPASRPNPVKEPATGRILPDLLTVDPLEERLRREAEERAARRRGPRGPRRVSEATSRPKPRSDGSAAGRAVIENAWEIGNMPVEFGAPETSTGFVRPVRRQVVTFAKSATRKTAPQRGLHSEWALRRACRKAKRTGAAMPLRAGERWKRRLPVSAW